MAQVIAVAFRGDEAVALLDDNTTIELQQGLDSGLVECDVEYTAFAPSTSAKLFRFNDGGWEAAGGIGG